MDTSKEYIKMSEKVFRKEEPKGSFVKYSFRTIITEHGCWYDGNNKEGYVPLKTQNQLQKLTGIVSIPTLLSQFNEFMFKEVEYVSPYFMDSWEKLWLAFVMKIRYNKRWDGKKWV